MQKPRPLTNGYHLLDQLAGASDLKCTLICGECVQRGNDRRATA